MKHGNKKYFKQDYNCFIKLIKKQPHLDVLGKKEHQQNL